VERILDGAHRVLIKYGYSGFTTRRVAEAAGMAPGNLAYHFPTKLELQRAMIARLMDSYWAQMKAFLVEPNLPPGAELESLTRWLLTDSVAEETMRTFRELWALSVHDQVISSAMDDFYDKLMDAVVELLQRCRPGVERAAIREVVQVLAVMSEGTVVMYGTRIQRAVPHSRFIELAARLLGSIPLGQEEADH